MIALAYLRQKLGRSEKGLPGVLFTIPGMNISRPGIAMEQIPSPAVSWSTKNACRSRPDTWMTKIIIPNRFPQQLEAFA
jgi:hypothetical protein